MRAHSAAELPPSSPGELKPEASTTASQLTIKHRIMERYPPQLSSKINSVTSQSENALRRMGVAVPHFVINTSKLWPRGSTINVAFNGGSPALYRRVVDTTADWSKHANIKFNFGDETSQGKYREWSSSDSDYIADIRISFNKSGYYSLVGTDSRNPALVGPGEESMNFERFDVSLPSDWRATILHEFGHALGFEHEHQFPGHGCDFRWDDEPGYDKTTDAFGQFIPDRQGRLPGIYTVLGGPPNNWKREVVDFNLRQLPPSRAFSTSGRLDSHSIMKYFFDDWMFVNGRGSECFTDTENMQLSEDDARGAELKYPFSLPRMQAVAAEQKNALELLERAMPPNDKYEQHIKNMQLRMGEK